MKTTLSIALGIGFAGIFFVLIKKDLVGFWSPNIIAFHGLSLRNIVRQIDETLSGSYVYGFVAPALIVTITATVLRCFLAQSWFGACFHT